MTLSFWINISKNFGNWRNIFLISNNSNSPDQSRIPSLYLYPNSTRFHFRFATTYNSNDGMDPKYEVPLGKDTHIVYVIKDNVIKFYVNGQSNDSKALSQFVRNTSATQLYMAAYHNCQDVKLKDFMIFNRALLPEEVLKVYTRTV
jgi:hypothetical protein